LLDLVLPFSFTLLAGSSVHCTSLPFFFLLDVTKIIYLPGWWKSFNEKKRRKKKKNQTRWSIKVVQMFTCFSSQERALFFLTPNQYMGRIFISRWWNTAVMKSLKGYYRFEGIQIQKERGAPLVS